MTMPKNPKDGYRFRRVDRPTVVRVGDRNIVVHPGSTIVVLPAKKRR